MHLGRVGIWTFQLDLQPAPKAQEYAAQLEELGYAAIWVPEVAARDALINSTLLLGATRKMVIGTGIANIWGRDAVSMSLAHKTISEAYPGRFLLGMGVSHQPVVEGLRGHKYEKPLSAMRSYLEKMDAAPYMSPAPSEEPKRVLAALGPGMLKLAAEKAAGAHPYFVPVRHTAFARETMGEGPLLCPEQAAILESDRAKAHEIARKHLAIYLSTVNYVNNLRRLDYGDDDLSGGGSDRLLEDIVAWGSVEKIADRVKAHLDAGANHVCIQVLPAEQRALPMDEWKELAPALTAL
jgi:probable F420-dependent oxidoreductase